MQTQTVYFSTSSDDCTGYFNVLVSKRRGEINEKNKQTKKQQQKKRGQRRVELNSLQMYLLSIRVAL